MRQLPSAARSAATGRAYVVNVLPMFEFTCQLAMLEPPPPEIQRLLAAVHGNQDAVDGFARIQ